MTNGPRAVILAAGQGTRMRGAIPKVLHPVGGRALVIRVVELAEAVTKPRPIVVVSPRHPSVRRALEGRVDLVEQAESRGSGDALRSVPPRLRDQGPVLVLSGDVPLLRETTISSLLTLHQATGADCTLLTVPMESSGALGRGLGRVVRDGGGRVARIVEELDLAPGAPSPREGNAGVYVFAGSALWPALDRLTTANAQREYYLTDLVAMFAPAVEALVVPDAGEAAGVNDRRQLARAEAILRGRELERLMDAGVTIEDPASTYVGPEVEVGEDSVILPMSLLRGRTRLGSNCVIGPMAQLQDVVAGDRVLIGASCLDDCVLGDDVTIGHYDRVRPNTELSSGVWLGTHAEVKNSRLGVGTKVSHFSCVLDSALGDGVVIGAGTVTCNFDGVAKHRTVIEDDVFVGTNSSLVAPLHLGRGSFVAAGSLIDGDVPPGALAIARARQRNLAGWVARRGRRAVEPQG